MKKTKPTGCNPWACSLPLTFTLFFLSTPPAASGDNHRQTGIIPPSLPARPPAMSLRRGWLLCFLGLGCPVILALDAAGDPPAARRLWQQGQEALRQGQPRRAIGFYEQSLAADPAFTR